MCLRLYIILWLDYLSKSNHLTLSLANEAIDLLWYFVLSSHSTVVGSHCSLGLPASLVSLPQCSLLDCPDNCRCFLHICGTNHLCICNGATISSSTIEKHTQSHKLEIFLRESAAFIPLSAHVLWSLFDFLFRNMSKEGAFSIY